MPATATATPKPKAAPASTKRDAGPPLTDHPVQRTVPAASAPPLSSVFAAGAVAKAASAQASKRGKFNPPDPDQVRIVSGKPIPPLERGPGAISPYQRLWEKLAKKGQCAEGLTPSQARSFQAWGKKHKKAITIRVHGETADAWRME